MAKLPYTEYFIQGRCELPPSRILRETLFALTITGSPLENACRVIEKYEPHGRGYYSGVVALIGHDAEGRDSLDSAILIRTADIRSTGEICIGVGSTLVRHSDPVSEAAETKAKAAGLLTALRGHVPSLSPPLAVAAGRPSDRLEQPCFTEVPAVQQALRRRNQHISSFWLADEHIHKRPDFNLVGLETVIVDAEDAFTSMIRHQLEALGMVVSVRRHDESIMFEQFDLVVMGPGPGDPSDETDRRIANLSRSIRGLITTRQPFVAVCLSHQILSRHLGLPLVRRATPNQGAQRKINLFGQEERVGFYNSFCAISESDRVDTGEHGIIKISRDADTGEVFAMRSDYFVSFQFHAESLLTQNGDAIFATHIGNILGSGTGSPAGVSRHHVGSPIEKAEL